MPEVKDHSRIDHDEHDGTLIPRLISSARVFVEQACSRAMITQVHEYYPWSFCGECIELPLGKLQSVDIFEWTDTAGVASAWTPSGSNLLSNSTVVAHIDTVSDPGRVALAYSQAWPSATLRTVNPIRIRFTCGYGTTSSTVPGPMRNAMLMLIDHWYYNTAAAASGTITREVTLGVDDLLANYRLIY